MNDKYLCLLGAGHFAVDINMGSLPAVLPFRVSEYGFDYAAVGGLMFAAAVASSIMQPFTGYIADRGSKEWLMPLGILMSGGSFAASGFTGSYWMIFALIAVMAVGSSIFHPEAAKLVNAVSGTKKGHGMSIFSVGGNAGFGLGPLLVVGLVTTFGLKGLAVYAVMAMVLALSYMAFLPKLIACAKGCQAEQPVSDVSDESTEVQDGTLVNDWPAFIRLTAVILFRSTVFRTVSSFLPLFCIGVLGASAAAGSMTLTVISLAGIAATLIGGSFSDRYGYVKTLRIGSLLVVPVLGVIAWGGSMTIVYAMLIPFSLFLVGTYSSFVVLGQSYLAKSVGFASGITLGLSSSLGGLVVPALGAFADSFGLGALMTLTVGIAAALFIATMLLPEPRN